MSERTHVALVSTGGTIEKTYDELSGVLENQISILDVMLGSLVLNGVSIDRIALMNKDSLDMTESDHDAIAESVAEQAATHDAVLVVHGTDRLANSGMRIYETMPSPPVPIVLTGAMRPYDLRRTDALQNLTEALLACQILAPGIYVAMHNRILDFPDVVKDYQSGTFVRKSGV